MEKKGKHTDFYRKLAARFHQDLVGNKLYLDPHFTLNAAAGRQGVTRHDLSHAVNNYFEKNFSRLVNELRIAEVVRIMQLPEGGELKIHLIALMTGFSDRKNFMRVCKQITGMSPTELKTQFNTCKL